VRAPRGNGATRAPTARPASDSRALLARIADLHDDLADAYRKLAETSPNRLDGCADPSPDRDVETAPATRPFLTVRDVAERLQVDAKTVRRWREEHRLPPAVSLGGVVRWRAETIDAWLAEAEETR
jgi:excisionase family DNA binding protein